MTVTGPRDALIDAYQGNLLLRHNGLQETLSGGKEYRISLQDDANSESNKPGPPPNSKPRPAMRYPGWFIEATAIGSAAIGSYMLWQIATESPYRPKDK